MRIALIAASLVLASMTAHATKPTPTPPPPQTQQQGQQQAQGQHQGQAQAQAQGQRQQASASSYSSAYGEGFATADNSLVNNTPRQVAAISQGSFAIQGCGVAGNAGGGNATGNGFLGFGFTPEQCYDFMLAQAYAAVGAHAAACEVLNTSRAGKRAAKRGVALPVCSPPVPPVAPAPVVVNVEAAAPAATDCKAETDKAFRQCVSK